MKAVDQVENNKKAENGITEAEHKPELWVGPTGLKISKLPFSKQNR